MNKYEVVVRNKDTKLTYHVYADSAREAENKAYGLEVRHCYHAIEFDDIEILNVKKV